MVATRYSVRTKHARYLFGSIPIINSMTLSETVGSDRQAWKRIEYADLPIQNADGFPPQSSTACLKAFANLMASLLL